MGRYVLQAVGNDAKERPGGPDLVLSTEKAVLLGRAVKEAEGYKFPNDWNSLSSRHCTLKYENVCGRGCCGEGQCSMSPTYARCYLSRTPNAIK